MPDKNLPPARSAALAYWFFVAIALLIVNAAFIYKSFNRFDEQKSLVTHTYDVIAEIEEIVSSLKDVHSAQRGYVITGQMDYLVPYNVAIPKIREHLASLHNLVTDNGKQAKNVRLLTEDAESRLQVAQKIITAYQQNGEDAAFALVRSGIGKKEMDQIQLLATEMVNIEKNLLISRQQKVDEAAALTLWLGAVGLLLCLMILGSIFILAGRENRRRIKAERVLQETLRHTRALAEQDNTVSQMADYLQGCRSTDEAFPLITNTLEKALAGTWGRIYMFNSSRNILESVVAWGNKEIAHDLTPESCWALRRGQTHIHTSGGVEPLCDHANGTQAEISVCLPMQAHGDTIGLFFISSDSADTLNDDHQRMARRSSEQISLAISNLKLQNTLRDQSIRDPLTGLFNRRYLEETMERELGRARRNNQPLCALVLDIDYFKKYNDTRGHDAGDALLAQFARLLQKMTRKEDIACRYGGEEFVIVLPMSNLENGLMRAEAIRAETQDMKVSLNGETFGGITVSIGVAVYPAHGEKMTDLIAAADRGLYFAKNNGRNQVKAIES